MKMDGEHTIKILVDLKAVEAVYEWENGKAGIQLSGGVRYLIDQQYEPVKEKVVQYQFEQ